MNYENLIVFAALAAVAYAIVLVFKMNDNK